MHSATSSCPAGEVPFLNLKLMNRVTDSLVAVNLDVCKALKENYLLNALFGSEDMLVWDKLCELVGDEIKKFRHRSGSRMMWTTHQMKVLSSWMEVLLRIFASKLRRKEGDCFAMLVFLPAPAPAPAPVLMPTLLLSLRVIFFPLQPAVKMSTRMGLF